MIGARVIDRIPYTVSMVATVEPSLRRIGRTADASVDPRL